MSIPLAMIVAVSENNVIGHNNRLPWKLVGELQYFKQVTMGKPIIMGRKTFESLPAPLPGRTNIVLTRDAKYQHSAIKIVNNIDKSLEVAQAIARADGAQEIMIIGGEQLYKLFMPLISKLYLTRVHGEFTGDAFFVDFDRAQFEEISSRYVEAPNGDGCDYSLKVLQRI